MSAPKRPNDVPDSDRVDEEAVSIAAEWIGGGAAEESEDGVEALESLGISFSAEGVLERLDHKPATLAEFEAAHGPVKPSDGGGSRRRDS